MNIFKNDKIRSTVFFAIAVLLLIIILLLIPCPNVLLYVLIVLAASIVAVVTGVHLLFTTGYINKLIKPSPDPVTGIRKHSEADVSNFRKLFMSFGLILSLFFVIAVINWTECDLSGSALAGILAPIDEIEVEPPLTKQEKPPPPPPVVVIEEVEDEEILEEEIEIEDTEADEEMEIEIEEDSGEEEIFVIVEQNPTFPGGLQKMYEFLQNNIQYPRIAREQGINGNVILQFVVGKSGKISDIKILRDIGGGCGSEAVRVVRLMPKWNAGKQRGKPVNVRFNLPIGFTLN